MDLIPNAIWHDGEKARPYKEEGLDHLLYAELQRWDAVSLEKTE